MVSLLDSMGAGRIPARCAMVISNEPQAPGLLSARTRGIPTMVLDHRESPSREAHDRRMVEALEGAGVQVVCLAGYMRLLSPLFVQAFRGRILNIHPALLPSFPGLHVQRKALAHGVRFSGCTVHVVDEEMDHGPILLQAVVPILPGDTEESLSARILRYEHHTYSEALRLLCEGKFRIEGAKAELALEPEEYRTVIRDLVDLGAEG
jgi:phosphoribosylglycinamide formyltransferase 1